MTTLLPGGDVADGKAVDIGPDEYGRAEWYGRLHRSAADDDELGFEARTEQADQR